MSTFRFSALRFSSTLALLATLGVSLFAGAQEPAPRARGRAKRPATQELKAPAPACLPECRSGYACVQGECVSKCNPGCDAGERCSDAGVCEASDAPPPKPARRGAKPARAPKAAPAETTGNNWGVAPPEEMKRAAEPADEADAAPAEAEAKADAPFGGKAEGEAKVTTAPAAATARPGVRRHDGFYMRLGVGAAALAGEVGAVELGGAGLATEFALGGTVAPGLVVGGGSYPVFVPTTSYEFATGEKQDGDGTTVALIGPFVDYYINPAGGLHVQGSLGLNSSALKAPSELEQSGVGLGLMLGVGYEWWVGEQWSMGVLGRLTTTASHEVEGKVDGLLTVKNDASFTTFGLLATFTYH